MKKFNTEIKEKVKAPVHRDRKRKLVFEESQREQEKTLLMILVFYYVDHHKYEKYAQWNQLLLFLSKLFHR